MKKLIIIMLAGSALFFNSCRRVTGEGPVVTENRVAGNFTSIAIHLSGTVYFKEDMEYKVEIKAQQNILNLIESSVSNNELLLKFKNNINVRTHDDVIIIISAPSVDAFSLSGSGTLQVAGDYKPANCDLEISGSGNISISNLVTNDLDVSISGSGDIQIAGGAANHQSIRISGSGSVDMLNLAAKTANTSTSGSGTVKVNLSERLDTKISGSGNVYYRGTPLVSASISGSGKIIPL